MQLIERKSIDKIVLDENEVNQYLGTIKQINDESKSLTVHSDEDANVATDFIRGLKKIEDEIKDFFKEPKAEAHKIHKEIVSAEKAVLEPLTEANNRVRGLIEAYTVEKQKAIEAKLREEEAGREKEAEKLLKEAEAHREAGDEFTSIVKEETALSLLETPEVEATKIDNLSLRTTWKARVIDNSKVPIEVRGMEIRPVDMKILNQLARTSKGKLSIPGVEFYQEVSTRIRG